MNYQLSNWDSAWVSVCFSVGSSSQQGVFAAWMSLRFVVSYLQTTKQMQETDWYFKKGCAVYSVSFNLLASRRESVQDKIKVPHATTQLSS